MTANEELLNRAVLHSHYLERLKTGEVNKIVRFLNRDVLPDVLEKLEHRLRRITARGFDSGVWTTQRLRETIAASKELLATGVSQAGKTLRRDLRRFAHHEADWQVQAMQTAAPINLGLATPSVSRLNSILTARPMQGQILSNWWSQVSRVAQTDIQRELNIGLAEGETLGQIVRRLAGTADGRYMDGVFGKLRRNVEATVRTATNHVNTHAREMTYGENEDVIKGVQFVATLDHRTTMTCMSLDSRVFPIEEGPRPPLHFQCRSTTIPVLKSWKELGINLKEAPPGTRESMTGAVPAKTSYATWLKGQPGEVQREILGPGRYKLFKGGLPINKFVNAKNQPLTLRQLRAREPLLEVKRPAGRKPRAGRAAAPAALTTVEANIKQLQKQLNVGSVEFWGDPTGKHGLKPLSAKKQVKTLTALNKEVARLRKEFPKLAKQMDTRPLESIVFQPGEVGHWPGASKQGALAVYLEGEGRRGGKIYVAMKDLNFGKEGTSLVGTGKFTTAGYSFERIFRHEYGHHIQYAMSKGRQNRWANFHIDKEIDVGNWWEKTVTRYAGRNHKESFAESFAARVHPTYPKWRKALPEWIGEFMEDLLI